MSFLAPLWLLLGAGALVPLLLHLLRRRIGARVEFPAARYLRRAEQEHTRSLRLRNLVLMLLRVLIVMVIALAAARPFVIGVGVGHGPVAVAIVLDNSLSTSAVSAGVPIFDRLRAAAIGLLGNAAPGDKLWLATADGRLRTGTRDALLADVQGVTPIEGAGDLPLALRRAAAAVAGSALPSRVVAVATDGQQSAWSDVRRMTVAIALFLPPGDPPLNRTVLTADAEPVRWTPRGTLLVRIDALDSVGYRIVLGEHTIGRGRATREEPVLLHAAPPERGWQAGRVELEPDDFRADDARFFAVWIGPAPAVNVDASAGKFAATAVAVLAADGRVTNGDAVQLAGADAAPRLPAVLLPPANPVALGRANRNLARLGVPWRFGVLEHGPSIARGRLLDGVTVAARYHLVRESAVPSDTLATSGGEPWLVAGPGYVLLGSRLDTTDTTLPVRAAFLPWLADVLGVRLGAPDGAFAVRVDAVPGGPVRLPEGITALESERGGGRREVTGSPSLAPAERGVWFMLRQGRRVGALVVNAPPEESNLARYSPSTLATRLGGRFAHAAVDPESWTRDTFASGTRRPALVPLLVFALLLMVVEAITVRTTRRTAS